jgi:hypothetical protein
VKERKSQFKEEEEECLRLRRHPGNHFIVEIKKILSDKSPGPSGINNRVLQAGDADFPAPVLIFFKDS